MLQADSIEEGQSGALKVNICIVELAGEAASNCIYKLLENFIYYF